MNKPEKFSAQQMKEQIWAELDREAAGLTIEQQVAAAECQLMDSTDPLAVKIKAVRAAQSKKKHAA